MLKPAAWFLFLALAAAARGELPPAYTKYLEAARNWGPGRSTPGASLAATELKREKTAAGTAVTYRLSARGVATSLPLVLVLWPLEKSMPAPLLQNLRVAGDGTVLCGAGPASCGPGQMANMPVSLTFYAAKGEPKRVALMTRDAQVRAVANIVPFPLAAMDRGCSVQAMLLAPNAAAVLVRGEGFAPKAALEFRGSSGGAPQVHQAKADAAGRFETVILPEVRGKTSGTHTLSLSSGACHPEIGFAWGVGAGRPE